MQNLFGGENSLLSEASKSRLFNGLVSRGTDAIARPIGEFLVWSGAGELGGPLVGQIFGWGAKGLVNLLGKSGAKAATQMAAQVETTQLTTIRGVTKHGVHQMITRGFKVVDVLKIVREGEVVEAIGRYGAQMRYTLNGNTVILNAKGKIVSVFSNMLGTRNGIGKGSINLFE